MPSLIGWVGLIIGGLSTVVCGLIAAVIIVVEVTDWQHDRNLRRRVGDHQRQELLDDQFKRAAQIAAFEHQFGPSLLSPSEEIAFCRLHGIDPR
jgi:hypothetical protein